jgi:hypothetical protein
VNNVAHHPNRFVEWAELIISILNSTCQNYVKIKWKKMSRKCVEITGTHGVNAFCAK